MLPIIKHTRTELGRQQQRANKAGSWKDKVALGLGSLSLGELSYLVMDRVAIPQIDPMCNLGVLLNL